MKITHIKADDRGHANHGWLDAHHMFSFAHYYNPNRMGFGTLRVLNDDVIQPGMGFSEHPHNNMEIITVPIRGALKHKDSMGNSGTIHSGEVQVMSAGTGVFHAELNAMPRHETNITQIWVLPNKQGVEPRYDQLKFNIERNKLQQIVSPDPDDEGSWIHSDSWFNHGEYDEEEHIDYRFHKKDNGLFIFLIKGKLKIGEHVIEPRDGFGIEEVEEVAIEVLEDSRILLLEVPMA